MEITLLLSTDDRAVRRLCDLEQRGLLTDAGREATKPIP